MKCPRCENAVLDERDRDGVTIDVCAACRGVWLDRGELEKLIARAGAELDRLESRDRRHEEDPRRRRDDDDDDDDERYGRGGRRKRGWFESFGDMFD
jgi:Zn-finger nucleic acid-binding protein